MYVKSDSALGAIDRNRMPGMTIRVKCSQRVRRIIKPKFIFGPFSAPNIILVPDWYRLLESYSRWSWFRTNNRTSRIWSGLFILARNIIAWNMWNMFRASYLIYCSSAASRVFLVSSQIVMAPDTWTFRDRIIPNWGISTQSSITCKKWTGMPSFSFPNNKTVLLLSAAIAGISILWSGTLEEVCSNPTIQKPSFFFWRSHKRSACIKNKKGSETYKAQKMI